MPLTEKGEKILAAMIEQYGEEKGTRVFYASRNAGTIEGVDAATGEKITVEVTGDEGQTRALLEAIKRVTAQGHSFSVVLDPGDPEEQRFSFDGDGACRIIAVDMDQPRNRGRWAGGNEGHLQWAGLGPPPGGAFQPGDTVVHPDHGLGTVEEVSGTGKTAVVTHQSGKKIAHVSSNLSFVHRMGDAGPDDEPRDDHGRWTSGGGGEETLAAAAVRVGGRTFTGPNHAVAIRNAAAALGESSVDEMLSTERLSGEEAIRYAAEKGLNLNTDDEKGLSISEARRRDPSEVWVEKDPEVDGFITSTGRYVSREEALMHPTLNKAALRYQEETAYAKDSRPMYFLDSGTIEAFDASRQTADGYLVASAKVARVGCQRYKGVEVGRPQMDSVVLYRPPEEVFAKDAMRSLANKPVTLTHPSRMVDAKTWKQHARGFSGTDVVRDGDLVRVPLMLTDAETIRGYRDNGVRELSVGYTTDIDWTAGVTDSGEHYDGIQRGIRANHIALVPVARGGRDLTLGDAGLTCADCGTYLKDDAEKCPECGRKVVTDASFTAEERRQLAKEGKAKPDGSYPIRNVSDLKNAISAWGRGGATASDKAWIIKRARALGATSELPEDWGGKDADPSNIGDYGMPKIVRLDGVPLALADAQDAAILQSFLRKLAGGKRVKVRDDGDGDGAYDYTSDDPDGDADAQMEAEKKERGYKDAIATRDGEIAALKQKLTDAAVTDAKLDGMIAERMAVIDAARPLLAKDFAFAGKSLGEIRRAAVSAKLGDAPTKAMTDAQVEGAFSVYATDGTKNSGVKSLADGMSRAMAGHSAQVSANDASAAYDEMVKRNAEAYRKPITAVTN